MTAEVGVPVAPATVIWWRQDPDGHILEFLEVGAGPPPLGDRAWPRQLLRSAVEAGGWAVANAPRLGPLPDPLTARLQAPAEVGEAGGGDLSRLQLDEHAEVVAGRDRIDADPLYEDCMRGALAIVAGRLEQRTVSAEPWSSGVLLARVRIADGELLLDVAPALTRGADLVSGLPVLGIWLGAQRGSSIEPSSLLASASAGAVEVQLLGSGAAAILPAVSLTLPAPAQSGGGSRLDRTKASGADETVTRVELLMPGLYQPALEQRWPAETWMHSGWRAQLALNPKPERG